MNFSVFASANGTAVPDPSAAYLRSRGFQLSKTHAGYQRLVHNNDGVILGWRLLTSLTGSVNYSKRWVWSTPDYLLQLDAPTSMVFESPEEAYVHAELCGWRLEEVWP